MLNVYNIMLITHIISATIAIIVGTILFLLPFNSYTRYIGYIWRITGIMAAVSSFLMVSRLSWIHALSITTIYGILLGMFFAYKKNWQGHRRAMLGAYIGMIIALLFTLYPSRLLGIMLYNFLGIPADRGLIAFYTILIVGMIYPMILIREYIKLCRISPGVANP